MNNRKYAFRINYSGEYEDSFIIRGYSLEEIRNKVLEACKERGWDIDNCWSEEL